jgi:adenylate cyclase
MTQAKWREVLLGVHPGLFRRRKVYKLIPSDPRCRFCNAPFGGIGGMLMPLVGRRQYHKNPLFCEMCLNEEVEGVEVELTMLFADVRGSTALAERMSASEFSRLINRFYAVATRALIQSDALIDKLVGDEVIGLYLPAFAGANHAGSAIHAAHELLHLTGHANRGGPWLPVGVGIHTGSAYVGLVGSEGGIGDLTALGDAVNITARLSSLAAAGEILVSEPACAAASLDSGGLETRRLELKGRSEPVAVRVLKIGPAA